MKRSLALLALLPLVASAKMAAPENVPVERLIKNVEAALKANPKDTDQLFLLARLHSMAYAQKEPNTSVYYAERGNPAGGFHLAPWIGVQVQKEEEEKTLSAVRLGHLKDSFLTYKKVVELKPDASLPKLGWGWVSEEAAKYPKQTANFAAPKTMSATAFKDLAIKLYREIVASYSAKKSDQHRWNWPDEEPAYEAAQNLQRLLKGRAAMVGEKEKLEKLIADYEARPMVMSPIIFPLAPTSASRLIDPNRTSTFDIAADGITRQWPWVAPQTAFLAWDPQGTGVIRDGRQLFGNRTFNMFFKDGYAALASLDDNLDGWLSGREMTGIVVWHDRNRNGVSDIGEVAPVGRWGIKGIRTKSSGTAAGMLAAAKGIRFQSGATVPTYDWLPVSKTGAIQP